jgi:hypothetical protein
MATATKTKEKKDQIPYRTLSFNSSLDVNAKTTETQREKIRIAAKWDISID